MFLYSSHSLDIDCLIFIGYVNSTLVALSPFNAPIQFGQTRTEGLHRLNNRDSLREKLVSGGNTALHLTPLSASASSSYGVVKSLSSGGDAKEEYPNVGKLAVNVQVQKHSRIDNEHLVSLVRFDPLSSILGQTDSHRL